MIRVLRVAVCLCVSVLVVGVLPQVCRSAEGCGTKECAEIVLFDGTDFSKWQSTNGGPVSKGWVIEEGAMVRKEKAGYLWTKERFGDFVLSLEFKTEGNSGVFFRTDKITNPVQTGIEMQIERKGVPGNKHSLGAMYDLLGPCKACGKPGEWNSVAVTAMDNKVTVKLNDEQIIDMDLDKWTEPNKNPDGSGNKFKAALKDFKREGHIGFQEHGAGVAYRNVKIRVLDKK